MHAGLLQASVCARYVCPVADEKIVHAAVIVAHPDDETLWAGGTILSRPGLRWFVAALCRGDDPDRAPKFRRAIKQLKAEGDIGLMDDGPEQRPLPEAVVQQAILGLLPHEEFDLVLTHSPRGEYTRHRRHEETGRAVLALWRDGRILTDELWLFAYEDGGRRYLPRAVENANRVETLGEKVWQEKHRVVTDVYGFAPESFEARTTPRAEAFWCLQSAVEAETWLQEEGK